MKRYLAVLATAAVLAGVVATDALAAGQGGGGQGVGGGRIGGGFGAGAFVGGRTPAEVGGPIINSVAITPSVQSTPLLTISPFTLGAGALTGGRTGAGVGRRILNSVAITPSGQSQQGSTQSYSYRISGNYPPADKSGQGSVAYSGGANVTHASPSDDQKAGVNSTASPQNASSQRAQRQSSDNETDLKVGARVRLRSGSPMMVVTSIHGSDVTCVWFNYVGQAESSTFPAVSLM
jgi:uncharacterized protein YodC (DUF2158 family)